MIAPVVIEFIAKNTPAVAQSIRNVAQTLARAEQQATRDAEKGARAREQAATREAKGRIAAYRMADAEQRRAQDRAVKDTESAARAQERAVEQSARARVRIESNAARDIERAQQRTHRAVMRNAESAVKAQMRFGAALVGSSARGVAAGASRVTQTGFKLANTAAQLGGGFSIADSVQGEVNLRAQAAAISASSMPGANGKRMTSAEILRSARSAGIREGIDPTEMLGAIGKFKDLTGDTQRATQLAPHLAKLSNAFGADIGELAENAGNIAMSSPGMSNSDVMNLLRVQTSQGAAGAVELKDMAKYGGRLTAGASLFGGDRATNIATMGAFAQVARQHGGAASPAEATLAAQRFATDIAKHHSAIEATGIKVGDGKGNLRDANAIMKEMLTKSGGDVLKFGQFGLGERGNRVLTGFADVYKQGGGGKAGQAAVDKELAKYTSGVSEEEVDKRAKERLGEVDKQLSMVMLEMKQVAGEQLLPEFVKMIPAIREMIPLWIDAARIGIPAFTELMTTVAQFVGAHRSSIQYLASNPIGAMVGYEITKSFAAAGLPALLRMLLSSVFGGGGPGPGGGGPGGGGKPTFVTPALATGVAAGAVVINSELGYEAGKDKAADIGAKVEAWQRGDHDRGMSPEAAEAEFAKAQARLDKTSVFEEVANLATSPFSDASAKAYGQYKSDQGLVDSDGLKAQIAEATTSQAAQIAALQANTAAMNALTPRLLEPPSSSGPHGAARSDTIMNR